VVDRKAAGLRLHPFDSVGGIYKLRLIIFAAPAWSIGLANRYCFPARGLSAGPTFLKLHGTLLAKMSIGRRANGLHTPGSFEHPSGEIRP
jgi:hypothetical protein